MQPQTQTSPLASSSDQADYCRTPSRLAPVVSQSLQDIDRHRTMPLVPTNFFRICKLPEAFGSVPPKRVVLPSTDREKDFQLREVIRIFGTHLQILILVGRLKSTRCNTPSTKRNGHMKTPRPRLILVLLLSLISFSSAFAQSDYPLEYREYEAIPFVGASFIPNFQFQTRVLGNGQVSSRTVGMRYDPGFSIGTRVHQNVGD